MSRLLAWVVALGVIAGVAWLARYDIEGINGAVVRLDRWTGCAVVLVPGGRPAALGCGQLNIPWEGR